MSDENVTPINRPAEQKGRSIQNKSGRESCGICADTGFVALAEDAGVCVYCEWGQVKAALHPWVTVKYAVNDVTPAVRRGSRISIKEYAQTPAGQADPNLDNFRRSMMAARKAAANKA